MDLAITPRPPDPRRRTPTQSRPNPAWPGGPPRGPIRADGIGGQLSHLKPAIVDRGGDAPARLFDHVGRQRQRKPAGEALRSRWLRRAHAATSDQPMPRVAVSRWRHTLVRSVSQPRPDGRWSECRSCPSPASLRARGFPTHRRYGSPHHDVRRVTIPRRSPPVQQEAGGRESPPPGRRLPVPLTRSPATPRPQSAVPAAGTTPRSGRPIARSARLPPRPVRPVARCPRKCCPAAVAVARSSKALPALTTPLRTGSPAARSTCSGSPVSTDSSSTATDVSDTPIHRHHLAGTDDQEIVHRHLRQRYHARPAVPRRCRANRGACSSRARRS